MTPQRNEPNQGAAASGSQRVIVDNIYDFKNVVAQAASKGQEGLKVKKQSLVVFKKDVSNKLEHIFNISKNLQIQFKTYYESASFMVGNESCLSDKLSLYTGILGEIQENCDKINDLIDTDIKATTDRLKSSRVL